MTKISQYTEASPPGLEDLLIGTDINETDESTKNFLIGDINTLFNGLTSLQDVVNVGNTIVMPTTVSRGIDITLANLGTVGQNGVSVTVPNQTGTPYSSPDAYVAKINGQSPGTLSGFIGGFVVDTHGLDNIGFYADLRSDSGTSGGCVIKSFDPHVGDLFRGQKEIGGINSTVFKVEHDGNVTGNSFIKTGGTAAQFLMANGSTSTMPTLQQVVDAGNSINLAVDDTEAIAINMSAASTVVQKGIRVTMPTQTAGSFPYSDCFIAKINGQSPGTLSNNVSGFYAIAQSGADNRSFVSEHVELVTASKHFSATNFATATSDFASFTTNNGEVFNIDYLGNVTANSLFLYDNANDADGNISFNDNSFRVQGLGNPNYFFTVDNGQSLSLHNGIAYANIINNLTTARDYTLPNASGTFALTSDITVPTLQQVTAAGSTTTASVIAVTSGKVLIGTDLSGTPTFGSDPHLVVTRPYTGTSIGGVIDLRNLAPSIVANDLLGKIQFSGKDDAPVGYTSSTIEGIAANDAGSGNPGGGILIFKTAANSTGASPIEKMRITQNGVVQPGTDNAYSLGASGIRWSSVWAANGTIQTSDEREKKDIVDSDLGLDFVSKLRPVSFKWKVGKNEVTSELDGLDEEGNPKTKTVVTPIEGKRTHYGLIAQEVETLLDGKDFGGFIHDSETDIKGLRYDQFIPVLINAIKELKAEIEILKAK